MRNFKKVLTVLLSLTMCFVLSTSALANTDIELETSTSSVITENEIYDADEWVDGTKTADCEIEATQGSTFTVTIPKHITLDGSTGHADFTVKATGNVAGDQQVKVTPDATCTLVEAGGKKSNVTANVTLSNNIWSCIELATEGGTTENGEINADLTAGSWSGSFNFNIVFENITTP